MSLGCSFREEFTINYVPRFDTAVPPGLKLYSTKESFVQCTNETIKLLNY